MAITVINDVVDNGTAKNRYEQAGITTGNEFIYAVNPDLAYRIDGIVTSAGSATAAVSGDDNTPTDFSGFALDPNGEYTANFSVEVGKGNEWVAGKVTSGTWTFIVREI